MSMLQVKNLPEDLHSALAERARAEGMTMSAYVTKLIRADLHRPTITQWIDEMREHDAPVRDIDVLGALDRARDEYDPISS